MFAHYNQYYSKITKFQIQIFLISNRLNRQIFIIISLLQRLQFQRESNSKFPLLVIEISAQHFTIWFHFRSRQLRLYCKGLLRNSRLSRIYENVKIWILDFSEIGDQIIFRMVSYAFRISVPKLTRLISIIKRNWSSPLVFIFHGRENSSHSNLPHYLCNWWPRFHFLKTDSSLFLAYPYVILIHRFMRGSFR